MLTRCSTLASALLLLHTSTGCSGSDSTGGSVETGSLEAFSSYCTGTLKADVDLMAPDGPGGWFRDGSQGTANAGTTFLVGTSFEKWEGYVMLSSGAPRKLDADWETGLVRDSQFTSDCATDEKLTDGSDRRVLLAASTFFANPELGGEPCALPVATELTSFGFSNTGSVANVSANEIETQCGWQKSYSADITYGELIPK